MDNDDYESTVAANVRQAITDTFGSVNSAARETGIAYATLDRKLRGLSSFNLGELRRIATATDRRVVDLLPKGKAA